MRTLSFENLRRLVGGRRKDRDHEPSFERSESFKRISIRKSYLDRGKRRVNRLGQKPNSQAQDSTDQPQQEQPPSLAIVEKKKRLHGPTIVQLRDEQRDPQPVAEVIEEEDTVIYGQWINDADSSYSSRDRKQKLDSYSSRDSYNLYRQPFARRNPALPTRRNNHNGQELERAKRTSSVIIEQLDNSLSSTKCQLGARSRSMFDCAKDPGRECYWKTNGNYSLSSSTQGVESGFEERNHEDDPDPIVNTVASKSSAASGSGFSLSLSFFRLTDKKKGFFARRKRGVKQCKPSPSVSTEGYFERTALPNGSHRRSSSRRGKPAVYCSKRRKVPVTRSSGRNCRPAETSPVWFVPPERRRSGRQRGRVWREVRYLPDEKGLRPNSVSSPKKTHNNNNNNCWANDSNLSDEFDDKKLLMSGDFEPQVKSQDSSTLTSSSLISTSMTSNCASPQPKISDFNAEKIFYESEYRGLKPAPCAAGANFFASHQFQGFVAGEVKAVGAGRKVLPRSHRSVTSSDSEAEERQLLVLVQGTKTSAVKETGGGNNGNLKVTPKEAKCSVVLVLERSQRTTGIKGSARQKELGPGQKRRPLRRKSQLKRANCRGQPVYLARKKSSLRRRPCSKILCFYMGDITGVLNLNSIFFIYAR